MCASFSGFNEDAFKIRFLSLFALVPALSSFFHCGYFETFVQLQNVLVFTSLKYYLFMLIFQLFLVTAQSCTVGWAAHTCCTYQKIFNFIFFAFCTSIYAFANPLWTAATILKTVSNARVAAVFCHSKLWMGYLFILTCKFVFVFSTRHYDNTSCPTGGSGTPHRLSETGKSKSPTLFINCL